MGRTKKKNLNSDSVIELSSKPEQKYDSSRNGVGAIATDSDKKILNEQQKAVQASFDEIPFLSNEGLSEGNYSKTPVLSNDNSQFTSGNNYDFGVTMPTSVTNLNLSEQAQKYVDKDYSDYREEGKPKHENEYRQMAYDNLNLYDKQVVDARQKVLDAQDRVNQGGHTGFVAKRELAKAEDELQRVLNASFVGDNATPEDQNAVVRKWLDPNYKMTKREMEQAKQIVSDYEDQNQFTNFNTQEHSAEEKQMAEDMYALRDKISLRERALQGVMGGIPFVQALQTKADTRAAATEWEENGGRDADGNQVTKSEYIDQYNRDHNTATAARRNAETQDPLAYNVAKIGTLVGGSILGGAALEGTAYGNALNAIGEKGPVYKILADSLKDAPIDVIADIAPNLANDIAEGKDPDEVASNLVKNVALNYGINLGVSGLQNVDAIKDIFKNGIGSKSVDEADSLFGKMDGLNAREYLEQGEYRLGDSLEELAKNTESEIPTLARETAESTDEALKNAGLEDYVDIDTRLGLSREDAELAEWRKAQNANDLATNANYRVKSDEIPYMTDPELSNQWLTLGGENPYATTVEPEEAVRAISDIKSLTADEKVAARAYSNYIDGMDVDSAVREANQYYGKENLLTDEEIASQILGEDAPKAVAREVSPSALTAEEMAEEQRRLLESQGVYEPKKVQEASGMTGGNPLQENGITSGNVNSTGVSARDYTQNVTAKPGQTIGNSKRIMNTEMKIDPEQAMKDYSNGISDYVQKHEVETMQSAANRIIREGEQGAMNSIMSIPDNAFTAEDVDTSMMLVNRYKSLLNKARESGDAEAIQDISSKLNALKRRQVQAASNAGQVSQAWAKWSRDADGAELATIAIQNQRYAKALTENKHLANAVDDIGVSVERSTRTARSADDIASVLRKAKGKNETIAKNLTDTAIDDYATRIYNRLRKGEGIEDLIDEIKNIGATGSSGRLSESALAEIEEIGKKMEGLSMTSKERAMLENQMYSVIADDINLYGSFGDKVNAWRYFSMLANPKTHIRNILGNTLFGGMTSIKDGLAGLLESVFLGEGERTKMFLDYFNEETRAMRRLAREDADEVYTMLVDGNKYYSGKHGIEANAKTFKSKGLNKLVNINGDLLNKEDELALYNKYQGALTRYLRANGADTSIFNATDETSTALLARAREYAIEEAKKATFHQTSKLADAISDFSRKMANGNTAEKGVHLALEATLPFKKTPINIIKSAAAYSPLEVGKLVADIPKVAKGTMTGAEFIDDLAKGLTGTAMLGGGFFLAQAGILVAKETKDGGQEYSVKVGNGTYTIDGFAPASIPLLMGASIYELTDAETEEDKLNAFVTSLASIADPVVETTMLEGIGDLLKSGQTYGDDDKASGLTKAGASIVSNYIGQLVPSELGNFERTKDATRRSSYTGKTGISNVINKALLKDKNKIPFLAETSEASIDNWGEENKNVGGNALGRFLYNHLSPGYWQETDMSDRAVELRRIAEATGDNKVLNEDYPTSTLTVNKESRKLTPEQYTQFSVEMGQMKAQLVDKLMATEEYKNLSDDDKASAINDIYSASKKYGTKMVFDDYSTTDKDFNTLYSDGQDALIDRILGKERKSNDTTASTTQTVNTTADVTATTDEIPQVTTGYSEMTNAGYSKTDKNKEIYDRGGMDYLNSVKQLDGEPDISGKIAKLEDMDYTDEERGYLLAQSSSSRNDTEKALITNGDYENLYLYRLAKDLADTDSSGQFNKEEKANFVNVLLANGYDEETAQYMAKLWKINK